MNQQLSIKVIYEKKRLCVIIEDEKKEQIVNLKVASMCGPHTNQQIQLKTSV